MTMTPAAVTPRSLHLHTQPSRSPPPHQQPRRRQVVLLLSVCHCQPSIYGVVLNQMTDRTMSSAFCPASAARYPAFVNSTIRSGGPNLPHWTVRGLWPRSAIQ